MKDKPGQKKAQPSGFGSSHDRGLAPAGLFLTSEGLEDESTVEFAAAISSVASPMTEFPSLTSKQQSLSLPALKKTLVTPMGLKQRDLGPRKEEEEENTAVKKDKKAKGRSKTTPQRATVEKDSIGERLKGLPGGLKLTGEETDKYFGEEGRANFFERYQWMNQQMRISRNNTTHVVNKLTFTDTMSKKSRNGTRKEESRGTAFGASRAASRARVKATRGAMGSSQGGGSVSLMSMPSVMPYEDSTIATRESELGSYVPRLGIDGSDADAARVNSAGFRPLSSESKHSGPRLILEEGPRNPLFPGDDISVLSGVGDDLSADTYRQYTLPPLSKSGTVQERDLRGTRDGRAREDAAHDEANADLDDDGGGDGDEWADGSERRGDQESGVHAKKSKRDKTLANHNFFNTLDDDLSDSDNSDDDDFYAGTIRHDKDLSAPMSPRSRYLARCLEKAINPRASLLVRKHLGKSLELQHHGIGDNMAEIFAASVTDIPYIQSINLADNNLTDKGMGPILKALVKIDSLIDLNLSQNVIGPESADCLAKYLAQEKCPLERLVLTKADIDDFECERFLNAIKGNMVLSELDLSNNLLGSAENLNTVMPDLITSGEALAELLRENLCGLRKLQLGWNMLRLDGGIELAESLARNTTLTYLDLSYNSLGHDGGLALGASIIDNSTLETLLVENNALDAAACVTICAGVIENRGLHRLAMDGNAIGVVGAKALMLVPTIAGQRVKVSATRCNVTIRDSKCWFDFGDMLKSYALHMENPFHRAVAFYLLHFVASHRTYIFTQFEHEEVPRGGRTEIPIVQARSNEPESYMDDAQKAVISNLRRVQVAAENVEEAKALFQEIDEDGSGELDKEELTGLLQSLGLNLDEDRIDDIIRTYDLDGGGTIGIDEFLYFLKQQNKEATARITDIVMAPVMTLDAGDGSGYQVRAYKPPLTGTLFVKVEDGFNVKAIHRTLSSCDRDYINDVANETGDALVTMTSNGIEGFKVRLDEALNLYFTMMRESRNKVLVLAKLLPQMSSQADARELVVKALQNDTADMLRLRRNMGMALGPMLSTTPSGFYALDLSQPFDRMCLERLIELSATRGFRLKQSDPVTGSCIGDVSQKRNYMAFRNESFNGKRVSVHVDFARPMPNKGHLHFDFSVENDADEDALVVSDETMVTILMHNFLLKRSDGHIAMTKLRRWRMYSENALKGDGVTVFEAGWERAMNQGEAQFNFDEHLHERENELHEAAQREEIKVSYDDGSDPPEESPAFPLTEEDMWVMGKQGRATLLTQEQKAELATVHDDDKSVASNESSTDGERSQAHEGDVEDELGLVNATDADHDVAPPTEDDQGHHHDHHSHSHHRMMRKLHILLCSTVVSDQAKAVRMVELIQEVLSNQWMRSRHVALLMECFYKLGRHKKATHFGSYRTELAVSLFPRIIDPHNVELVMGKLEPYEAGCFVQRVGLLNIFNAMKPEGSWELDLGRYDERVVAKCLCELSVKEPGDNWPRKQFRWSRDQDYFPGWELVGTMMSDEGFSKRGVITVEYYSGEGICLRECKPFVKLRKAMMKLTTVKENSMVKEDQPILKDEECVGEAHLKNYSDSWYTLLITKE